MFPSKYSIMFDTEFSWANVLVKGQSVVIGYNC